MLLQLETDLFGLSELAEATTPGTADCSHRPDTVPWVCPDRGGVCAPQLYPGDSRGPLQPGEGEALGYHPTPFGPSRSYILGVFIHSGGGGGVFFF